MKSICEALLGRVETEIDDGEFNMDRELERQAEQQINKDCITEIDRYRRMDEWTSSFHNLYARTAIDCQRKLMKSKLIEIDLMPFLQYTRAGSFDPLRLDAFEMLIDFEIFRFPDLLKWFIYTMSSDTSAWIRHGLHRTFGKALAAVAFGDETAKKEPPQDNLIIEQESSTEIRQANLARRQTVPGALEALKKELSGNAALKEALWAACNSQCVGVSELCNFVYICSALYEPVDQRMVTLKYPRYWGTQHLGNVSRMNFISRCIRIVLMVLNRVNFDSSEPLDTAHP